MDGSKVSKLRLAAAVAAACLLFPVGGAGSASAGPAAAGLAGPAAGLAAAVRAAAGLAAGAGPAGPAAVRAPAGPGEAASGKTPAPSTTTTAPARPGGTLNLVMPWATVPHNFNPLAPGTTSATAGGTGSLLYEPLMYDNPLTGQTTPMLATGYAWSDGNRRLTVKVRKGVRWADGQHFSAADVAFTFNYLKEYPQLDVQGDWYTSLQSVTATSASKVVFTYARADTVVLPFVMGQLIVPEHVFARVTDPARYANLDPIGTGPFVLRAWGPKQVTYVRNGLYWMPGRPLLDEVVMHAAGSTAAAQRLVASGNAACTYGFIAAPNQDFVAVQPQWDHYWWPVTALNMLYMNTQTGSFNDVNLRKAVAMSINTKVVADRAYNGAVPGMGGVGETGVVPLQQSKWVPASVTKYEWTYDPSAALALLTSHNYKISHGVLALPTGQPLPTFKLLVGAGWPDFMSIATTISQELRQIGIRSAVNPEPFSTYYHDAQAGNYDLMVSWSNGNGGNPYFEYYYLLSSAESAPAGQRSSTNWERFSSSYIDNLLGNFAITTSLAQEKDDMAAIETTVLTQVPMVPLTGRPNYFEYSTRYFTGWPGPADAYNAGEPPDSFDGGAEQLFLNVHLG